MYPQVRVLQAYVNEQDVTPLALNYDFGLVTLSSPAPSGTTSLAIAAGEGNDVVLDLVTAGYPADKASNTMWQVRRSWALCARHCSAIAAMHRLASCCAGRPLGRPAHVVPTGCAPRSAGRLCQRDDGL